MDLSEPLICPRCSGREFSFTKESTYLYTYKINSEENIHKIKSTPFIFDNREKENSSEYVVCEKCGAKYPVPNNENNNDINLTIIKKAITSDCSNNP